MRASRPENRFETNATWPPPPPSFFSPLMIVCIRARCHSLAIYHIHRERYNKNNLERTFQRTLSLFIYVYIYIFNMLKNATFLIDLLMHGTVLINNIAILIFVNRAYRKLHVMVIFNFTAFNVSCYAAWIISEFILTVSSIYTSIWSM